MKIPWVLSPVLREPGMAVPACNLSSQEIRSLGHRQQRTEF